MANEFKVKKGLIVQGSGSTLLDIQGSQGQLFSVTDSLSGSLFSVNDISGMPIMEVFSDDRVLLGTFNAEAIKISGSTANITGSLFGTSSWAVSASWAPVATTAATASFVTASNVFGPFGSNSILSASFATTASFITGSTNAFIQNGNSFGTTALLGTNDNQSLALETSGSTRMFISSSGDVGVGTTTPVSKLHVVGPVNIERTGVPGAYSTIDMEGNFRLNATSGYATVFLMNGTEAGRIMPSGYFGIGTTSPGASLHIVSSSATLKIQQATGGSIFSGIEFVDYVGGLNASIKSNQSTGEIRYSNAASYFPTFYSNGSEAMRISTTGNIGIGTTSPNAKLDISGSALITGSLNVSQGITGSLFGTSSWAVSASWAPATTTAATASFVTASNVYGPFGSNSILSASFASTASFITGSTNAFIQNGNSFGTTALLGTNDNNSLALETSGSTRMFISSSGNVGIGTTSPQSILDVITPVNGYASFANQMSVTQYSGIHFGYRENNTNYRKSAIVFERTDLTEPNAQGKIHILNGPQSGGTSATLSDAKLTINEAGNIGIGKTTPGAKLDVSGSAIISGSFTVTPGTVREFQVNTTGVDIGNIITDRHTVTGSLLVSGSITGSLFGTSSWAVNSVTSSYPLKVSGNSIFSTHTDSAAGGTNASTTHSIFIGRGAGDGATTANNSTFIGYSAGQSATNANNSTFIGNTVGVTATNAYNSNFFGASAGYAAGNANDSNFFGASAGGYATSASFSNFIGNTAGNKAASASYSNLIGFHAGYNPSFAAGTGIKSNNIIIGTNITLPDGTRDSVNIGGIIFATGSYATTAGNPYSGSVNTGRVGIGKVTPSVTLDISGSTTVTGSLNVSQGITGSLFGTASWAVSASWAPGGGSTTPGGSNTQIQYNNGGAFGGVPNLTWDGTTLRATGSLAGNASTATLLANARTLWGRTFDGTANVTGDLTSVGTITGTSGTDLVISTGGGDRVNITTTTAQAIRFNTNNTLRWIIDGTSGNLTSTGAQTITTTTGNLTLATNAGNGNILLTPNGTGRVGVNTTTPTSASLTVSGNVWATSYTGSLFGTASWAVSASWAPGGGGSSITVQDEGSTLTTALTSLNFVGSGVAATNSGGAVTVTIAGAGGSAFPYTGSAEITGSLRVTGSITSTTDATINSVTVGRGAGNITTNIVIGSGSLINNTTGGSNTAIGHTALQSNSTGSDNTAVGAGAGQQVTGNGNTLIGSRTGEAIVSGHNNTLIGGNLRYGPDGTSFAGSYTLGIGKMSVNESRVPHIWAPEDGSVTTGGTGTLLRLDPTKYSGFFIEYVIDDTGGKMRSGTLKGIFKSDMSAIQWAEVDALTIGNTSAAIFTVTGSGTGYLDVLLANNIGSTIYHSCTSRLILRN